MLGKIGRLRERPVAIRALERLVAVMRALVDGERPRDGKRLAAAGEVANVRLWTSVISRQARAVCSQKDSLSRVCRRLCCASVAVSEKYCPQISHWNGRWPVWLCRRAQHSILSNLGGGSLPILPGDVAESFACSRTPCRHVWHSLPTDTHSAPYPHQRAPS